MLVCMLLKWINNNYNYISSITLNLVHQSNTQQHLPPQRNQILSYADAYFFYLNPLQTHTDYENEARQQQGRTDYLPLLNNYQPCPHGDRHELKQERTDYLPLLNNYQPCPHGDKHELKQERTDYLPLLNNYQPCPHGDKHELKQERTDNLPLLNNYPPCPHGDGHELKQERTDNLPLLNNYQPCPHGDGHELKHGCMWLFTAGLHLSILTDMEVICKVSSTMGKII